MNHYHYWTGNEWHGPFSWEQLIKLCRDGVVGDSTQVSLNGSEGKAAKLMFGETWAKMSLVRHSEIPTPPVQQPPQSHHSPHVAAHPPHLSESAPRFTEPAPNAATSNAKKKFIVFDKSGERRFLIEAFDAVSAKLSASVSYRIAIGDAQEVDSDITEEQFNQIKPRRVDENFAAQEDTREFLEKNGTDKLMIIGGIIILIFFGIVYEVTDFRGVQNRNIGCAVGIALAVVGAIRMAIVNRK